ncbi:hypothetical protein BDR03DRAFT_980078 [Suillus americanus]|nr:hypothetical protein BDR03DRAFT_980078 [Suillus americanus]
MTYIFISFTHGVRVTYHGCSALGAYCARGYNRGAIHYSDDVTDEVFDFVIHRLGSSDSSSPPNGPPIIQLHTPVPFPPDPHVEITIIEVIFAFWNLSLAGVSALRKDCGGESFLVFWAKLSKLVMEHVDEVVSRSTLTSTAVPICVGPGLKKIPYLGAHWRLQLQHAQVARIAGPFNTPTIIDYYVRNITVLDLAFYLLQASGAIKREALLDSPLRMSATDAPPYAVHGLIYTLKELVAHGYVMIDDTEAVHCHWNGMTLI